MTDQPSSPRRRFLTTLAGGAAAVAAGGLAAGDVLAQRATTEYPPPQGGWDLSWVEKVEKAKHKIVFDSPEVGDALALTNASVYLRSFKEVYQMADADLGVVVVFRHNGMPVVVNDSIWSRLKLGESSKTKDSATGEPATKNPWARGGTGGNDVTLDALLGRGVIVLACNLALMRLAGRLATAESIPVEEARKQMIDALVPGVIRQHSGLFAAARAQEAGCQFIRSV